MRREWHAGSVGAAALALSVLGAESGCDGAMPRPTSVPEFPASMATPHATAWAAFELPLRADGSVVRDGVRTLGWEASGAPPTLFVALRNVAAGTTWEAPERPERDATGSRHIVQLLLDGRGQPLLDEAVTGAIRSRVEASLAARHQALEALGATAPGNAHALDCAWMGVDGLRSGAPFLHDDVHGWPQLEPRLREVEARNGGVWVCRAARSTHQGQFVFLDAAGDVLAVEKYILGE